MRPRTFLSLLILAPLFLILASPSALAQEEGTNDADFISQSVPAAMVAGQTYSVSVTMANTGTTMWTTGAGFNLGSQNPPLNSTWGLTQVSLNYTNVSPGSQMTFAFTCRAPAVAGIYNFQWQMFKYSNSGPAFFGDKTLNVAVNVTGGTGAVDNAVFVTQNVTTPVTTGSTFPVTITMRNTGTTTWTTAGGYKLGSQTPALNTTWGLNQVALPASVAPGSQATFTFNAIAPSSAGSYNFQWQMLVGSSTFFGQMTTLVSVTVEPPAAGVPDAQFIAQSIPTSVYTSSTYGITVTMKNTGTTTWTTAQGYKLASQNPALNSTWGTTQVNLPSSVAPGAEVIFAFNVTAPATAGAYNCQWQMYIVGTGFFGEMSPNIAVTVSVEGSEEEGVNNAAFVSQSVPTTIAQGQTFQVSITMTNTGTSTWTTGAGYSLGSQNPAFNYTWSLNEATLPTRRAITPGNPVTFTFTCTAPAETGLYNFQWQMFRFTNGGRIFFGDMTPNVQINVTGGTGGSDDAAFVAQNVTTPVTTGTTFSVSITMRNSGSTTWTSAGGYRLGSQSPPFNTTWGLSEVALPSSVAPGSQVTFTFNVTAPATAGLYNFQWQMLTGTSSFFGQLTPAVTINVEPPGSGLPDAQFISQTMPDEVYTGTVYGFTVTVKNIGTTTWTSAQGYKLASQNPALNSIWAVTKVNLPSSVAPGDEVVFQFNATAPATAGTYNCQWQMYIEGIGFFGEITPNVPIAVTAPPASGDTGFGNNLGVPAIFAEGYGVTGLPTSIDPGVRPVPGETNTPPYFDPEYVFFLNGTAYYPQQTVSTWQAEWANGDPAGEHVVVNWADNLLNQRWTATSSIRIETVLYKTPLFPMTAYNMQLLSVSGNTERWGTDGANYPSSYATVFSPNARLKIEKLTGPGGKPVVGAPCGFDGAVYERYGATGLTTGYSAEVNASGNLIYGFNWQLNQCTATATQKQGWWRLTFSIDPVANYSIPTTEGGTPQAFSVPRNIFLDSSDPGDALGRYAQPVLYPAEFKSVVEIQIVSGKGGGGGGGGGGRP